MDARLAIKSKGLTLENFDHSNFGYLVVRADAASLTITYNPVSPQGKPSMGPDTVTVNLKSHTV